MLTPEQQRELDHEFQLRSTVMMAMRSYGVEEAKRLYPEYMEFIVKHQYRMADPVLKHDKPILREYNLIYEGMYMNNKQVDEEEFANAMLSFKLVSSVEEGIKIAQELNEKGRQGTKPKYDNGGYVYL